MFDIGFWELVLIGIMGLVILGPERLPVAIRTVRGWISGARRFSDTVKSELTEELRVHELHANLKKAEQADLKNLSPEVAESLKALKEAAASVNEPFKKVDRHTLDDMISDASASSEVQNNEVHAQKLNNISLQSDNETPIPEAKTTSTEESVEPTTAKPSDQV